MQEIVDGLLHHTMQLISFPKLAYDFCFLFASKTNSSLYINIFDFI